MRVTVLLVQHCMTHNRCVLAPVEALHQAVAAARRAVALLYTACLL